MPKNQNSASAGARRSGARRRSCIVIGAGLAGLAGLAAARELAVLGFAVTVLEAQNRFGGRVRSFRFKQQPALVCELGAEWIGRQHFKMLDLCSHYDLHLDPHQYGFTFWKGVPGLRTRRILVSRSGWCRRTPRRPNMYSAMTRTRWTSRSREATAG